MKPTFLFASIATVALALFAGAVPSAEAQAGYSLKAIESRPIPRDDHFALWKDVALRACSESKERFNLEASQCRRVISERGDSCAAKLQNESPLMISSTEVSRHLGRKYLQCATPYYFCKGVEVKTEEEARSKCR